LIGCMEGVPKVGFLGRFRWRSLSVSGSLVESKAQRCRAFLQR
jgi:hypothetical protein